MTKNINSISLAVIILWVLLPVTNLWSESTGGLGTEYDNGTPSSDTLNVDWSNGSNQKITLGNGGITITYTAPSSPSMLYLKLIQPSTINLSWSTVSGLNQSKYSGQNTTGSITSALTFGGYSGSVMSNTEKWSGSSWATTTAMNSAKDANGAVGNTSSAMSIGGSSSANQNEMWNGSSWSTTAGLVLNRNNIVAVGSTSSHLAFGGYSNAVVANTEVWSGSSYATTTSMSNAVYSHGGFGGSTSAVIAAGGVDSDQRNYTQVWNGSSWATTTAMANARCGAGSAGSTSTYGIEFGSYYSAAQSHAEIWNGSSWATYASLNTSRGYLSGCGKVGAALAVAGYTGNTSGMTTVERIAAAGTVTWPTADKWSGGNKTLTSTANAVDLVTKYYDGTNYYNVLNTNFS